VRRVVLAAVAALCLAAPSSAAREEVPAARAAKPLPPLRLGHRCVTELERKRVVRFTASDRTRLIGVVFGAGRKGVVLAHQGGGGAADLCGWVPYARRLAAAGYRVLAFDHRGRGFSGTARTVPNLQRVDLDAAGAIGVLRARGATSVVLAGASLGGAAVLAASARVSPPVDGVISLSSPQTFVRVDALEAVRRLSVPALFIAAEGDFEFADDARALHAAAGSADKRLEIVPGAEHGVPLLRRPDVRALVDGWIASHSSS
jgi:pimeloyl-ACP methyl ester carboxylesterase